MASNRERARLAWRQRVDAAARGLRASLDAWRDAGFLVPVENEMTGGVYRFREPEATNYAKAYAEFRAALAAPKPWASPQRPDPRRRYSRSHRRGCCNCQTSNWYRKMGPCCWYETRIMQSPHERILR